MTTPLEIQFHGVDKSEAVETRIREKVERLEKKFGRMTHCRVVVESPRRNNHKGTLFLIKILMGMPGRPEIVVSHEPGDSDMHGDVYVALRDAFDAAQRRLDEEASRMTPKARHRT